MNIYYAFVAIIIFLSYTTDNNLLAQKRPCPENASESKEKKQKTELSSTDHVNRAFINALNSQFLLPKEFPNNLAEKNRFNHTVIFRLCKAVTSFLEIIKNNNSYSEIFHNQAELLKKNYADLCRLNFGFFLIEE